MAYGEQTRSNDKHGSGTDDVSELPLSAPRRLRARIDFGPPPISSSAPPCRIIDSEPKHRGGGSIDV